MENELPEEWITFTHNHRVERASARARSELSASLGPVSGKSNYSKRDRKLLRSRSSLSIYTVCSDQGSWGGNVQRASGSPTSSYPSRRGVQGMAEYTFEPHVRFPLFSNLTVLFVFSCSCTQVPRSFSLFISFMRNLDDAHVFENMNPSFRVYEDTQLEILRIIFRSVEK